MLAILRQRSRDGHHASSWQRQHGRSEAMEAVRMRERQLRKAVLRLGERIEASHCYSFSFALMRLHWNRKSEGSLDRWRNARKEEQENNEDDGQGNQSRL